MIRFLLAYTLHRTGFRTIADRVAGGSGETVALIDWAQR